MSVPDHVLRERIEVIFQQFDRDRSGYLDVRELQRFVNTIFESLGDSERLDEYEAMQFLNQIDHNNDQRCSQEEVFRLIKAAIARKQQRGGYGGNQYQGYGGNEGYGNNNNYGGNQNGWGGSNNYGNNQNNNGWGNEGNNQSQENISKPRYGGSTPNQGYGSGSGSYGSSNNNNGW